MISIPELAPHASRDNPLAGRYVLEREIGRGGMAVVVLANDLKHERQVAVKVLGSESASRVNTDRFLHEIRVAAGLTHPNILPVHDSGAVEGLLYYVMPYIEGETLENRIEHEGALPIAEVTRLTGQIGRALQHAHERGIVHRDIKPANVLLPAGVAVVADFGLARALQRDEKSLQLTDVGLGVGTPIYMSPEQSLGESDVDAKSDQYSFACTVFEMLTGKRVFDGTTSQKLFAQHVSQPPPRARDMRADVPAGIDRVLQRALAKSPADRFGSVGEFTDAFEEAASSAHAKSRPLREILTPRLIGVGVAIAVVAAAVGIALRSARIAALGRTLNENVVVVAPFETVGEPLKVWSEGLMDVVSHALDGAGSLRSVSSTQVVRAWKGRADRAGAVALGRATGAGMAVAGQLVASGTDSVRLMAKIYDVRGDSALSGDIEIRGLASRMDRISDSIAVRISVETAKLRRGVGALTASLQSRSLPALKAFLTGEQFYRKNQFATARPHFAEAIALDSTFALAYHRLGWTLQWMNESSSDLRIECRRRAGGLNHGLGLRDSLLILADSLNLVVTSNDRFIDATALGPIRRQFDALAQAVRAYPRDPEVLTEQGEAMVHGVRQTVFGDKALEAFEKAIRADSLYGPAYSHAVHLTLVFRGADSALAVARRYLRLNPADTAMLVLADVLRGDRSDESLQRAFAGRNVSKTALAFALARWPDRDDTGVRLYQAIAQGLNYRYFVAAALAFRGRITDALARPGTPSPFYPGIVDEAPVYTLVSKTQRDVLDSLSRVWLTARTIEMLPVAAFGAGARQDTAFLTRMVAVAINSGRSAASPLDRSSWHFIELSGRAYGALARGDSAEAEALFKALPDSTGPVNQMAVLALDEAGLFNARGHYADAMGVLDRHAPTAFGLSGFAVLWALHRARSEYYYGTDPNRAMRLLAYASAAWERADAPLRALVDAARTEMRQPRIAN